MTLEEYCREALERGHGHHTMRVQRDAGGRVSIAVYPDAAEGATCLFAVESNALMFVSSVTWRPTERHAAKWARRLERRATVGRRDVVRRVDASGNEITGP